jgi:Lon protease-like protein
LRSPPALFRGSGVTDPLPLFPLKTVLFPGGPLLLRVFEPRYLDMVARCLRGANRFGVVAIRQGGEVGMASTYDVGTTAEIVDWHQESGGLLGILAMGRETFRLQQTTRQSDGLYLGAVTLLPPDPPQPLPLVHAPLAALLRGLVESSPAYGSIATDYEDAVWVAGRLTETLPLALAVKQSLLETADPLARLERIAAALRADRLGS